MQDQRAQAIRAVHKRERDYRREQHRQRNEEARVGGARHIDGQRARDERDRVHHADGEPRAHAGATQALDNLLAEQSHEQSEGQAKTKGLAPQRRNLAISNLHNDVVRAVENRLQHNECRKYHVLTLRHFEPSSFFNKRKKLQGLIEEP